MKFSAVSLLLTAATIASVDAFSSFGKGKKTTAAPKKAPDVSAHDQICRQVHLSS